jgi:hypothetical protein
MKIRNLLLAVSISALVTVFGTALVVEYLFFGPNWYKIHRSRLSTYRQNKTGFL